MGDFDFGLDGFRTTPERLAEEREHRLELARRVMPFNITYLDDCCLGIYPTDLIVLCAASGAGKTTVAALLAQLAASQGRRVHFFALEAHRSEIEQRMLFREICHVLAERGGELWGLTFALWMYGRAPQVTPDIEEEARCRLAEQARGLKTFYRERRFTPEDITRLFLAVQNETDLIVLDHLHYIDSDDRDENRALKAATKAIRDAALDMEKPVVVVAHMRKKDARKPRLIPEMDDVHGSSEVVKIATKVVMLAPARDRMSSEPGIANTYMQVIKDRFAGTTGIAALLQYDLRTLRYRDPYTLGRLNFAGNEFVELSPKQKPRWATHAVCAGTPETEPETEPEAEPDAAPSYDQGILF